MRWVRLDDIVDQDGNEVVGSGEGLSAAEFHQLYEEKENKSVDVNVQKMSHFDLIRKCREQEIKSA